MRVFSIALIALVSLAQAQAQAEEPTGSKKPGGACSYTLNGNFYEVQTGENLCWRSPPPYGAEYALLHCSGPILQEGPLVKRGDPRCGGQYELRQ
jgi:hypothetical protein